MNIWPNGTKHVMSQRQHAAWNANNYPGTRQLCFYCDEPTGRCEEDSIYLDDDEYGERPLCKDCYHQTEEGREK